MHPWTRVAAKQSVSFGLIAQFLAGGAVVRKAIQVKGSSSRRRARKAMRRSRPSRGTASRLFCGFLRRSANRCRKTDIENRSATRSGPEEPVLRCAGGSTGEAILADPYRHNHPLLKPLTLDRPAKLSVMLRVTSAAKSAGASRSGYRGSTSLSQTITTSLSGGAHETSNVPVTLVCSLPHRPSSITRFRVMALSRPGQTNWVTPTQ